MRFPALLPCLFISCLSLAAQAAQPAPALATGNDRHYVDVDSYFTRDADIDAWYTLTTNLRQNFDYICGDTFCEGDYSNIESLNFTCSVEQTSGVIGQCVWIFAASNEDIDPDNGRVLVDTHHWRCRVPLAPRTCIADLLTALAGAQPLNAVLPDSSQSIYDGLVDCL